MLLKIPYIQIDTDGARDIIEAAYCSGINFFDNAEAYAYGKSEEIMGKALEDLKLPREEIVISTKIYHGNKKDPAPTARGLSRKHVIEGLRGKKDISIMHNLYDAQCASG